MKVILCTISLICFQSVSSQSWQCTTSQDQFCTFTNIQASPTDAYNLRADEESVEKIQFNNSKIAHLNPNFCDAFTNVWDARIWMLDIEEIGYNALQGCKKLKIINLYQNKLTKVDNRMFAGLVELEQVHFTDNLVKKVDLDAFKDNANLNFLNLARNKLRFFGLNTSLLALTELDLSGNQLMDLDVEGLFTYLPRLKLISIGDNYFQCSRLTKIVDALKTKGIQLKVVTDAKQIRKNPPKFVEGQECYDQPQQEDNVTPYEDKRRRNNAPVVAISGIFLSGVLVALILA